jgi:hypothetical protein
MIDPPLLEHLLPKDSLISLWLLLLPAEEEEKGQYFPMLEVLKVSKGDYMS